MLAHLDLTIKVLAALLVILTAATVCGRLANLLGQPRVVGEMVAGVLLGPSLLGLLAPDLSELLFPDSVKSVLYVLSTIGLTYYMFLVGLTIDHRNLDRLTVRHATAVGLTGILLPFALGAMVAVAFYEQLTVAGVSRLSFVLFLGGALSITAFPMLARILQERRVAKTPVGAVTLLAGAIDDAVAWGLLAIVVAVATSSGSAGAVTILGAAGFAVAMLTVGRRLFVPLGRKVEREGTLSHGALAVILLSVMAAAWFTEAIGVFAVFGGFIVGLCMPPSPTLRRELQHRLMDMNLILLLPIFFAFSGLNTQMSGLANPHLLLPLAAALVAACAGKYLGCALTARWGGLPWRHSLAVGGLMNARGLMILVFINVGLVYGIVSSELFAILVLVAIITTAAALPLYRLAVPARVEQQLRGEDGDPDPTSDPDRPRTTEPVT